MKKILLAGIAAVLLVAAPVAAQTDQVQEITLEKIIEMSKAGLSNETIINAIITSNADFVLTVDDILRLKNEGVSEDVINFLLRTQPETIATDEEQAVVEDIPEEAEAETPAYVDAEGNYYDGYTYTDDYVYTDGYYPEDDRYSFIIYHYYGPWLRHYPFYFGFYYYPTSYYYYHWWPDDYYYYFYYPRFSTWRYYYYYPFHYRTYNWAGRHYYAGGRYIKTPSGRYIRRYGSDSLGRAVPRGSTGRTISSGAGTGIKSPAVYRGGSSPTVRSRSSRPPTGYTSPSIRYRSPTPSRGSTTRSYTPSTSGRTAVPRSSVPSVRSRSSTPSRGSSVVRRPSTSSRPSISSRSRSSSSSSRSRSSSSARKRH